MGTNDLVVGVDGSPSSRRALRWASAEAGRRGARLRVVAAYRTRQAIEEDAGPADPNAMALTPAEKLVDEMVALARGVAPTIVVDGLVACGSPVKVLSAAATDGSLIVVGNRGRGGFGGLLLGSTGLHLATHTAGPVVIVRGNADEHAGPIVAGADGSPGAEAALGMAFEAAATRRCTLITARAYRVPVPQWGQHIDPVDFDGTQLRAAERALLRDSVGPWREKYPDVAVETLVVEGDAASVLMAMSSAAQLVVVGTRGHGGLTGRLLGSVGQKLVSHAHCPVLVAR